LVVVLQLRIVTSWYSGSITNFPRRLLVAFATRREWYTTPFPAQARSTPSLSSIAPIARFTVRGLRMKITSLRCVSTPNSPVPVGASSTTALSCASVTTTTLSSMPKRRVSSFSSRAARASSFCLGARKSTLPLLM
jgi:hypothetical protein